MFTPFFLMHELIKSKFNAVIKLNENKVLKQILNSTELQEEIIYLNTIDQLFEKGQDKLGRDLDSVGGGYSPFTIQIKQKKGQPYDRVTLKDTGDFYNSFQVVNQDTYIEIIANPIKNGKDINLEWGGYVIGLQPQNMKKIIDEIKIKYIQIVRRAYRLEVF